MRALRFRPHAKNSLVAFFDLELDSGLVLRGCTLHLSHDKHWVGLPARPHKDASGADTWAAIVDFRDKATRARFQAQATVAALEASRRAGRAA
jgi:hypothetical protein